MTINLLERLVGRGILGSDLPFPPRNKIKLVGRKRQTIENLYILFFNYFHFFFGFFVSWNRAKFLEILSYLFTIFFFLCKYTVSLFVFFG